MIIKWNDTCLLQAGLYRILLFQIHPEPDPDLRELVFGSQNNSPHETNGVNNAATCYKEAVQFSVFFVTSLFASFWQNLWNCNELFVLFFVGATLTKTANMPLDRSAALVLYVINCIYRSYNGICEIRQEIWLELDLARFPKNGGISDLPELEPKSSTSPAASNETLKLWTNNRDSTEANTSSQLTLFNNAFTSRKVTCTWQVPRCIHVQVIRTHHDNFTIHQSVSELFTHICPMAHHITHCNKHWSKTAS